MENLQEKLEAIAVYDGWYCYHRDLYKKDNPKPKMKKQECFIEQMKYLTSLDWLHPVAMKVIDELYSIDDTHKSVYHESRPYIQQIELSCASKPNSNGEYTDLFNAVYDGIQFINQYKNK